MTTIKINRSGTSQSVQLPADFRFNVDEVEILRRGDERWSCAKSGRTCVRHSICWHPCPKISVRRGGRTYFQRSEKSL